MRRDPLYLSTLIAVVLGTACSDAGTPTGLRVAPPRPSRDVSAIDPGMTFCSSAAITIRDAATAVPFPSTLVVSGVTGGPFKITARLNGISHPTATDIDVLLVGPTNVKVMLMSDAAGGSDLRNATLVFDDDAPAGLPATTTPTAILPSGTYKPTNFGAGDPIPGGGTLSPALSAFSTANPNGTWNLYLWDDTILGGGGGSVSGGWCVTITPINRSPMANVGGPYGGAEGSPISFDGSGSSDPDGEAIASYTWDFGDGSTGTGPTPTHAYAASGTYTVRLTVADAAGAVGEATTTATVSDVAPTATFGAPPAGNEGTNATIAFTATSMSDARYAFDCGRGFGAIGTASTATCALTDNGEVTVKGRVYDPTIDALFTEYTAAITVTNVSPTATFGNSGPVSEGTSIVLQLSGATDPSPVDAAAGFTYAFDCGTGYGPFGSTSTIACPTFDDGTPVVRAKVRDKDLGETEYTANVVVANVAPQVTSIVLPSGPVAVGTPITLSASFTDVGTRDTHGGSFDLGNGGSNVGTVTESDGSGTATSTVTYSQPGVYTIRATVTDDDGGVGSRSSAVDVPAYIVVYDPTEGFVTGGGWITSPPGALASNPSATGKASFGFVAKYHRGATTPAGNTEFQFKAGDFAFSSTSYEWLVVAGSKAMLKGEGAIAGAGEYGFMLTAIDGDLQSSSDSFRIKIWNLATGAVVYDNRMGAGDDSGAATTLGGGSIVIHK